MNTTREAHIREMEEEFYPYAIALGYLAAQTGNPSRTTTSLEGLSYHMQHGAGQLTYTALFDYMKREFARNPYAFRIDLSHLERPEEVEPHHWFVLLGSVEKRTQARAQDFSSSFIFIDAFLGLMEDLILPRLITLCEEEGYPFTLESEHLSEARHIINRVLKSFVRSFTTDFAYRTSFARGLSRMKIY